MADKRIQDLTAATSVGLTDLFVLEQSGAAKSLSGQTLVTDLATLLDGHGGISNIAYAPPVSPSVTGTMTITLADTTQYTVSIQNGNGIASIAIAYGISNQGTNPAYVISWSNSPVAPTDASPYQWTRIRITDKTNTVTDAYSISMKTVNPTITVGTVTAESGADAGATITNSGTAYNPTLDFAFTLPQGDKGDTGDYIDPVVSFGTSTAAATEPTTWYSSASSLSYTAGNFIWQRTEYTLHGAGTVQSTEKKIIGYIGQNGSGSGTVQQITLNGTVYTDDGTGNVPITLDAEDVGAVADPSTKSNGQVLTWDGSADEWVAANPSTGNVNTVNSVGVDTGTTNITLYATDIKMSSSNNTTIPNAIPSASSSAPASDTSGGFAGTGTTWARGDHRHSLNTSNANPADLANSPTAGTSGAYARSDHAHRLPTATAITAVDYGNAQTLTTAQKQQAKDNIAAMGKNVVVWENSAPTSNFVAQTLAIDLSGYDFFGVVSMFSTGSQYLIKMQVFPVVLNADYILEITGRGSTATGGRRMSYTSNGLAFQQGTYDGTNEDTHLIPYIIYGMKGLVALT